LAYAQQIAYGVFEPNNNKKEGDKDIQLNWFVNVENSGATLKIDNYPINKLQYIPRTNVLSGDIWEKDSKGKYKTDAVTGNRVALPRILKEIPAKWVAFSSKAQMKYDVTYEYLRSNFSESFLNQVKDIGKKQNFCYTEIPPGCFQKVEDIPPSIKLLQSKKNNYIQEEGTHTCLIVCLANILHFSNCRHHAALLHNKRFKFEDSSGLWKELNAFLLFLSPLLLNRGIKLKFEDLTKQYYYNPLITNVEGSDGKKIILLEFIMV